MHNGGYLRSEIFFNKTTIFRDDAERIIYSEAKKIGAH